MLDVSWCIFVSARFGSKLCTLAEYHSPVNRICGPAETLLGLLVHQSEPRITPEKRSRVKRGKTYFGHTIIALEMSLPSGNGHKYSLHLDFLWVSGWYRSRPIFGVDHTRPIGVTNLLKKCLVCPYPNCLVHTPIIAKHKSPTFEQLPMNENMDSKFEHLARTGQKQRLASKHNTAQQQHQNVT